ncbi:MULTISPECIES: cupin domain-containing protein [Actinomycetaceae]|uniref:cupin domain-containing protein n=1 Tax=Actinomycetaceae TaxID=2049 RepID=UPI0008A32626|nr:MULTISPECIES: cupin domain-containing protein [Actinomycetaceae]MBS5825543.1 cupin domain-containing protein [Actinomyces sp.]MBS6102377.1 cupin domain-containing protein [Actinomyces sp.]MDP9835197.1 mannose-6-phosphate isomerase-like protein (cupin superfamily) [Gleimia europaea]MDU4286550.1 cupin domain-containing protein [Actinomyces sp.]MDU4831386.1 cupin domain-containing protein [Actinomyces sp.]
MTEYAGQFDDQGKKPYVIDIEKETLDNTNFRTTMWTGEHIQLTVMEIPVGGDIGLEVHEDTDQFLRIEQGKGRCEMGPAKDDLNFVKEVEDDFAIFVPAGAWHNVTNIGEEPLKLYTIYGPADHLPGTVHKTQADAEADPHEH